MSDVARSNGRVPIRMIVALKEGEMVQVRLDDIDQYYFLLEFASGELAYRGCSCLDGWQEYREIHRQLLPPKLLVQLCVSHPQRPLARRLRVVS